ncbi:MAG: DNA internalization-related competence protein ComEC/Rec2 [Lachnospiraceae bacterium]|nr:DNA internalization-related competence protein ComEC/Rec2 [Lachnospiraceae bacterium]
MNKRPLCLICIFFILGIWVMDVAGIPDIWGSRETSQLHEYIDQHGSVDLWGQIYEYQEKKDTFQIYLTQTVLSVDSKLIKIKNVKITCREACTYSMGTVLHVRGQLKEIEAPGNPGQFDSQMYYAVQDIGYTMWEPETDVIKVGREPLQEMFAGLRGRMAGSIDALVDTETAGVLKSIVLGDKSDLEAEQKVQYQMSGISHILAISGLHLTLLGMGLYQILRKMRAGMVLACSVSGMVMIAYAAFTGNSVATLRALIMFLLLMGAKLVGRTYDLPTALAVSALVLLIQTPAYIRYSGFLLSFSAVAGSLFFSSKNRVLSALLLYLVTLPMILYFFYEFPTYGVLVNLLVVPSLCVVLLGGLAGGAAGIIQWYLGKMLILPAQFLLHLYEWVGKMVQWMPGTTWIAGQPEKWNILLYYVGLGGGLYMWQRYLLYKRRFLLLLALPLLIWALVWHKDVDIKIVALDVGQGDNIVISTSDDIHYLIDGGSSTVNEVGTYRIIPYLKSQGIDTLEYIFVSHTDADHMNGVAELLEAVAKQETSMRVKHLVLPRWSFKDEKYLGLEEAAAQAGVPVLHMQQGDRIMDGDMTWTCLYPDSKNKSTDINALSMTLDLNYKKFDALFTGDLEGKGEDAVLGQLRDYDYLKVAHHGSKYSTEQDFLDLVKPEVSVISCGENNRYGHPHEELIQRLEFCGTKIYRTDQAGAITCETDGETWRIYEFRES